MMKKCFLSGIRKAVRKPAQCTIRVSTFSLSSNTVYLNPPHCTTTSSLWKRTKRGMSQLAENQETKDNLAELERDGFTVVSDVFSTEEIKRMQRDYATIKARAEDIMHHTEARDRIWQENGEETRSKYWKKEDALILQAGEGRFDLWRGFKDGFFGSLSVLGNQKVENLISTLLVDDYTNYAGVILSLPGSKHQYYHRDTDNLQNKGSDGHCLMTVDDFYFTLLIPISVDVTKENGTAEFFVGSHRHTSDKFESLDRYQAECPVGSALLFNGKINHRGRGNDSLLDRPVIYLVYHKRWYNDSFRKGVDE